MAFVSEHEIYDALPIPNDALDKGGVEMLRAGVVDEELFVTARRAFAEPAPWGYVLADITRRLATLYAAEGGFTEAKATAAITVAFAESFRVAGAGVARRPVKRAAAKAAPRVKAPAKSKPKPVARRKSARAKP
jgi:Domain of unknown function (DUF5076)